MYVYIVYYYILYNTRVTVGYVLVSPSLFI